MRRLIVILLIIGGLGFLFSKNVNHNVAPAPSVTSPEHAALTNMALQSETRATQAVANASTDRVAEYEKGQVIQ